MKRYIFFDLDGTLTDPMLGITSSVQYALAKFGISVRYLKELISYFEQCDEKTVILMFGDHQPNVETGFLESLYGKDYDSLSEEELSRRYITPFVLWANYDSEEERGVQISAH